MLKELGIQPQGVVRTKKKVHIKQTTRELKSRIFVVTKREKVKAWSTQNDLDITLRFLYYYFKISCIVKTKQQQKPGGVIEAFWTSRQ